VTASTSRRLAPLSNTGTSLWRQTPLGAVLRGAVAGAAATVAMDVFQYARFRAQGGQQAPIHWEFGGPTAWDTAPVPGQLGRRLYEGFRQRQLDERLAPLTNNVMHWGYGIAWGAALGVVAGSLPRTRIWYGPAFGIAVWASSYAVLPITGLYKPIWQYGFSELAPDLIAHLTYGSVAERSLRMLSYGSRAPRVRGTQSPSCLTP
jgi:hypothetical protein